MSLRTQPKCFLAGLLVASAAVCCAAQQPAPANAQVLKPEVLPVQKEMDLALSAAPDNLRDGAAVYVLEQNGFVKVRDGSNGFTCIVNRDHPLNLKPTCYDSEGTATILPKVLRVGELMMAGKSMQEIVADIKDGFKNGRFISPRRPGVAYMLSGDIKVFNPQTKQFGTFPPHVMFYAPNLTNADIGSKGDFQPGMPSIGYQGPHGYMIVVLGAAEQKPTGEKHPGEHE